MEKQIALEPANTPCRKPAMLARKAALMLNAPVRLLCRYYSLVLGHDVDMRQTRAITEAQLAFFATVIPADMPILMHAAACAWFVISLRKCRQLIK